MRIFNYGILSWLFFLVNAVQFNVEGAVDGGNEPAGSAEPAAEPAASSEPAAEPTGGSGTQEPSGDSDQVDFDSLPPAAQKYIKGLRKESADYRTKLRGTEDRLGKIEGGLKSIFGEGEDGEQVSPEDQISNLTGVAQNLSMQNAVLSVAVENGLNSDQAEYFQFLIGKEGESLEENEELSEERFDELMAKVKAFGASAGGSAGNTSVDDGGKPPEGGSGEVTLEQFKNMGYMEKVSLRKTNEPLYNKLFAASVKQ